LRAVLNNPQRFHHPIAGLRGDGADAGERGVGGALGVQGVILTALASIGAIRCGDFQDLDTGGLEEAQQARAVGAGAFHAHAADVADGAHPGQHRPVAGPGGGKELHSQNPVAAVDDRGDVQVLVGVHTTDDDRRMGHGNSAGRCHGAPGVWGLRPPIGVLPSTSSQDRTVTRRGGQALLESHGTSEAKPRRRCSRATDESEE